MPTVEDVDPTTIIVSELLVGALLVAGAVYPMLGRGGRFPERRDRWSRFDPDVQRAVIERADGRCEAFIFLLWGSCRQDAVGAEHVVPWEKGGSTVVGNARALCEHHQGSKSGFRPPWWLVLCLEFRRRRYFPEFVDVRVSGALTQAERRARGLVTPSSRTRRGMARPALISRI